MDAGVIIAIIVIALLLLALLAFLGSKRKKAVDDQKRSQAIEHRRDAELRDTRADKAEAEAEERAARARREEAQAREQAELARRERSAADEMHTKAADLHPDHDADNPRDYDRSALGEQHDDTGSGSHAAGSQPPPRT